ncbi:MAG: chromosomal replication initiator protein DnaA, partial [Paracoccaceae bacterium]
MERAWKNVRSSMQKELGTDIFNNWISALDYQQFDSGRLIFNVPSSFIANWVETNYGDLIIGLFKKEGWNVTALVFEYKDLISGKDVIKQTDKKNSNSKSDSSVTGLLTNSDIQLPSSPLDKRFTFDRFVVGKPNELAHAAARRVAEGGAVTFNPLFLYGGVGLGKTHLMHAIAWQTQNRNPDARMLYLSAEQFMYRFVQALRFKDMHGFKELFRSVDILMVDDVQFIAGKESTQDEFFHTFNALVDHGKQIVISGDRAPGEIDGLEDRIKSRLAWGLVVDLHPTDYELRLGILQSKVEVQSKLHPGIYIDPGILEFLAHRISSNVRVLEGSLTRLYAYASLVGRKVDIDMAQ